MSLEVAIVGGGPAGLAVALECQARGISCVVLERRAGALDKACGEGLMPSGLVALERLGVRPLIPAAECSPFTAIRYVQEDGRGVDGPLPAPGGLGVRRLALAAAMAQRADAVGIERRQNCTVHSHAIDADGVTLQTDQGEVRARLLVAADGLHSARRKAQGLELTPTGPRRFGLWRHFALAPWAPRVEVHFTAGAEAYVTPSGTRRVGIAFLWEDGAFDDAVSFEVLLARFPALAERLRDAEPDSRPMGAGPLLQRVLRRTGDRFALVGDAAGYVDAITGEGLSLAFEAAACLGALLPLALEHQASRAALEPYERQTAASFRRYARLAGALVWAARHPALRRWVVNRLIGRPELFSWALQRALASPAP